MAAFMSPSSLPPPTKEDLNFEDPPAMINDDMQRVFWCISSKVREVILDNIGKHVFFCFHNGFCTYQSDYDKNMAKARIDGHFTKNPSHRLSMQDMDMWKKVAADRKHQRDMLRRRERSGSSSGRSRDWRSPVRSRGWRASPPAPSSSRDRRSPHRRSRSPSGSSSPRRYVRSRSRSRSPRYSRHYDSSGYRDNRRGYGSNRSPGYYRSPSPPPAYRDSYDSKTTRYPSPRSRRPPSLSPSPPPNPPSREHNPFDGRERRAVFETRERNPFDGRNTQFEARDGHYSDRRDGGSSTENVWTTQYPGPGPGGRQSGYYEDRRHDRLPPPPDREESSSERRFPNARYKRSYNFPKTYGPTPGAVGRFNSRMDPKFNDAKTHSNKFEEVCKDRGLGKGCGRVFHNQDEYIEHIKERKKIENKNNCPELVKNRVCKDEGTIKGCGRTFDKLEAYQEHIRVRNKTPNRRCPGIAGSQNTQDRNRETVKTECRSAVYTGPSVTIDISESPEYVAPGSPLSSNTPSPPENMNVEPVSPPSSLAPTYSSPMPAPVSPPTSVASETRKTPESEERPVSPPPCDQDNVTVRDDGVILIPNLLPDIVTSAIVDDTPEKVPRVPREGSPKRIFLPPKPKTMVPSTSKEDVANKSVTVLAEVEGQRSTTPPEQVSKSMVGGEKEVEAQSSPKLLTTVDESVGRQKEKIFGESSDQDPHEVSNPMSHQKVSSDSTPKNVDKSNVINSASGSGRKEKVKLPSSFFTEDDLTPAVTVMETGMKPSEKRKRMDDEMELLLDKKQRSKFIKKVPHDKEMDKTGDVNVDEPVSVDGIIPLNKSTNSTSSLPKSVEKVVHSESQVSSFAEALTQASQGKPTSKISSRRGSKDKHSSKDKRKYIDKSKTTDNKSNNDETKRIRHEQTATQEDVSCNAKTSQVQGRLSSIPECGEEGVADESSDNFVCSRCNEIFTDLQIYSEHSLACNKQDLESEPIIENQVGVTKSASFQNTSDTTASFKEGISDKVFSSENSDSTGAKIASSVESSNDSHIENSTISSTEASLQTLANEVESHEDVNKDKDSEDPGEQSACRESQVSIGEKNGDITDTNGIEDDDHSETCVDDLFSDVETSDDIASVDSIKDDAVLISLRKALCSTDDEDLDSSDSDDDEDSVELVFGKDDCNECPRCHTEIEKKEQNISINIVDGTYIVICESCHTRIVIKNALSERQKAFLFCRV